MLGYTFWHHCTNFRPQNMNYINENNINTNMSDHVTNERTKTIYTNTHLQLCKLNTSHKQEPTINIRNVHVVTINNYFGSCYSTVTRLLMQRLGFNPSSFHMEFGVDKMALGQTFLQAFCFPMSVSFHQHPTLIHLSITNTL